MEAEKKLNLNERVYLSIKDMIMKGQIAPGEKLKEIKLSEKLNVSRTPVRDALKTLEKEGLVVIYPSQGAEVTNLSKTTIKNLYQCRAVLEGLAVRQATPVINKENLDLIEESIFLAKNYFSKGDLEKVIEKNTLFHDKIVQSSGNDPLIQMMKNIRSQILRYRTLNSSVGFRPIFADEHFEIHKAMTEGKEELAESLMREHILGDLTAVLEGLDHMDQHEID
ncbi:MAG TPA: GntR family transcriptional regulator [Bacillales bacterium]